MQGLKIIFLLGVSSIWAHLVLSKNLGSRIINGIKAEKGQFPWQVALYVSHPDGTDLCGGALISDSWILTAGHCVQQSFQIKVALGSNFLTGDDPDRVVISTKEYVLHDNFSALSLANDVALIPLKDPITLSATIQPITLADEDILPGTPVTVSGWGATSDTKTVASPDLIYTSLVIISSDECEDVYGFLNDDVICAVEDGDLVTGTCEGDSGGPLIIYDDGDTPIHVGVVSYGHPSGCGTGKPSGYAETSRFRDWIRDKANI